MTTKEGWRGRFFEDFAVGDVFQHPLGRTVTEADEVWFCNLVTSPNQLHFNRDYASRTRFGKSAVNAPFTNALVTGLSVSDISQNGINVEWTEIKVPNPLFIGETVYAETEVLEVRELKSRPDQGLITVKSRGITAEGKVVIELIRKIMVYKRDRAPQMDLFPKITQ